MSGRERRVEGGQLEEVRTETWRVKGMLYRGSLPKMLAASSDNLISVNIPSSLCVNWNPLHRSSQSIASIKKKKEKTHTSFFNLPTISCSASPPTLFPLNNLLAK